MKPIVTDYECTTSNKGNPFDQTNKAVCLATRRGLVGSTATQNIREEVEAIQAEIDGSTILVFFNAKFDLHWHRRYDFIPICPIWCCQLAEFYLGGQREPFPSLEHTAQRYGLGKKIDVVKTEYWDKGICTSDIPWDILSKYACQDVDLTYYIFLKQYERFQQNPKLYALFTLACQDLQILEEMEWNGLRYSPEICQERAVELREKLARLDLQLHSVYPDLSLNFGSGDQLSAFLYGGTIVSESQELVGTFKTGDRKGLPKFSRVRKEHQLPRLIEPLERSELQKPGFFATDEGTLRKLKGAAARKYVPILLERAKLEKLIGTYYEGIPKLAQQMNWEPGYIHGQFHQVVAATGRLSSSKPNQQNFAGDVEDVFISRFESSSNSTETRGGR